jgi:hypothetical protein
MVDAGSIWIRLGLNADELRFGLDKAKYGLQEWRGEVNQNSMEMAKWGAAIAAELAPVVAIGAVIYDATTKAAAFGAQIKDNARDLGMTTDEYQQWSHATVAVGGNADAMTESVRMMTVRMKEAVDPTSEIGMLFADLGVKVVDSQGNLRSTNEVLLDTFAALNRLPEGFARNQAQMQIFGRGFSNISDLAEISREELQALLDQSPVFDSDKIEKMDRFNDELILVNEQWNLMYVELGTELIPVVEELMPFIQDYGIPAVAVLADVLQYAGRGFHIVGSEAKAAYEIINNHDLDAAKKEMEDLAKWIQATQTADALKAAGYTEGAYWDGSKWVKPTKPGGVAPEVVDKNAEQAEKDRVAALVDAWKEYQDQIKKVQDQKTKLYELDQNYLQDVQFAGRDVSQIRSLTMSYNRSRQAVAADLGTDQMALNAAATEFNAIRAGQAIETVSGTKAYEEAQAKASGPLAGITITGNIYLNGDKSFEKYLADQRRQKGVRT